MEIMILKNESMNEYLDFDIREKIRKITINPKYIKIKINTNEYKPVEWKLIPSQS
jgi:hypothetical protein